MTRSVLIRHSIFARLVLWAIAITASIVFGLWALTDTTIAHANRIALERAVDLDLGGLADIYATSGEQELARRIEDRLAIQPRDGSPAHYLLAHGDDRPIAGDLAAWPALHASISESGPIYLESGETAYARATQLGPDVKLAVAHESDISALRRKVAIVFSAGGVLATFAVALAGWIAVQRLATRIERINAAFRQPDDRALAALVEGARDRDEIDELTDHSANALEQLRHVARNRRETTDQVAHEIRTPLMHLDNRLVKALAATPDPETAASIVDARGEIRAIIRMLESLLDIATSRARRGDRLGLSPVDLSALAMRLGELYADSAEDSGHRLVLAITPGVTIDGEEMQLTRLITNLLDNAFKFVPPGGTVELGLKPGPVLTVRDDGPGVADADREKIFDKFARGSERTEQDGAGLGLALCRAIAERHGLAIVLAATQKGASFAGVPGEQAMILEPQPRKFPRALIGAALGIGLLAASPVTAIGNISNAAGAPATLAPGERIAMALAAGDAAHDQANRAALAAALGVIDRSGAHPLEGWSGTDPVPGWRSEVGALSAPLRGSTLGPGYRLGKVHGGEADSFEQVFLSGRRASIAVSTSGPRVSLRVLDGDKRQVCLLEDARKACNWVPLFTQRYRIEVRNPGAAVANYFLVVD